MVIPFTGKVLTIRLISFLQDQSYSVNPLGSVYGFAHYGIARFLVGIFAETGRVTWGYKVVVEVCATYSFATKRTK
jgi:uncharacterized protein YaaQ